MKIRIATMAFAVLATLGVTVPAFADGDDGYRGRDWREHEWREHEWREREWREHHYYYRPYATYYTPRYYYAPPPPVVAAPSLNIVIPLRR